MEHVLLKIKQIRVSKGLTQQDMANSMGYKSKSGYCQLEKGEVKLTLDKIELIANVLEVDPQILLSDYKTNAS
ncbi:helix-turn-helix domain-containing protein [Alkaliphilus pronyensis]|nr:helix-turn-helix transcriptional regulator [Alkaliphilus pronyensis]